MPLGAAAKSEAILPRITTTLEWTERLLARNTLQAVLAIFVIAVATLRIVATYEKYNQTFDEGAHIAAGLETLDRGTFDREPLYPPLTRMTISAGPYIQGARTAADPLSTVGNTRHGLGCN